MSEAPNTTATARSVEEVFAAAMAEEDVRGRSLWTDAWHRLLKNRAALVSGVIMTLMILAVVFGPWLVPWEADFTDWDHTSSPPSLATGHWFGTDAVGRDILARTLEGGRISLLVGLVAFMTWIVRLGLSTHGIDPIEAQYAADLPSGVTLGRASIAVLIGLVTLLAGFGILMSIHSHRKLLPH